MLTSYAAAVFLLLVLDVFLNVLLYLRPYIDLDKKRQRRWRAVMIAMIASAACACAQLALEVLK